MHLVIYKVIMINRNSTLDPRRLGTLKPALVCDQKLRPRSSTARTDSLENHDRRKLQLSRQGCLEAPWRPSEARRRPSHLETKPVTLKNTGQQHVGAVFLFLITSPHKLHDFSQIQYSLFCLPLCVLKEEGETERISSL